MTQPPERTLLAHWPLATGPNGRVREEVSGNDGRYGIDARWIWFTDPRAIRYVGQRDRTYLGYLGGPTGGDIRIAAFDHATDTLERTTLASSFSTDDHTNPSVLVSKSGTVHVFWTGHNGDAIFHARSYQPESIEAFEPPSRLEQYLVTYPNPVELPGKRDELLYLFYRDRTRTRDATNDEYGYMGDGHVYVRQSIDGGVSWSEQMRLVTAPEGHYGAYFVHASSRDVIHLFVTDAERGGDAPKWDVRHARFTGNRLEAADGTAIAASDECPVPVADLELVYDSATDNGEYAWVWDAAVDERGEPAVVYATFPSPNAHRYRYARWNADEGHWLDVHLREAGGFIEEAGVERHYSAGVALDPDDPDVTYVCVAGENERTVERLETTTGGRSWRSQTVRSDPVGTPMRPVVPANASPDLPVLWLEGEYEGMHASQTVLCGVPTTGRSDRLRTDGDAGITIGLDCFPERAFDSGVSVSAVVSTAAPHEPQTILQFGDGIRLDIARNTAASLEWTLSDGDEEVTASYADVDANQRYAVEGHWSPTDGLARLSVDGDAVDEHPFEGPIAFDGPNASWTLAKDAYLLENGLRGELEDVRLHTLHASGRDPSRSA